MEKIYQEMRSMLNEQRELLIVGHEDPDCDCLGSMLGLYLAFDGEEKNWRMLRRDPVPANLTYLPHLDKMMDPAELDIPGQAVLLLDCGEARRTGSWLADMLPGKKLYCIDHHISNAFQGDLALVEPEAAAASEIVAALALADGRKISDEAALCLYSGMAADTGCFRYNNTSPRSLALAAQLLPQINLETVRIQLFEDRSYANAKMIGVCFDHIQLECDGKLCYSYFSRADREPYQAGPGDCHNIVNYTLSLHGVKVGLIFEEYDDYVKMSFRCRSGYRVDRLAQHFHGGGHELASGCKLPGNLETVMPMVLAETRKLFDEEASD